MDLLERVHSQEGDFDIEVVVVDSGSTDGTPELARRYGARVREIPKSEFNHGATRNLGISLAGGEYVVLTVQDAVPVDEHWLSAMVENLERDERVAGVYARQLPHGWAGPLTRVLVNGYASARPDRREHFAGGRKEFDTLPPNRRRALAAFDNVSSCIRRSVWEELPFDRARFGEDIMWGKKVIEAGYKTVYEPRSAVYHSHERGGLYDLRRHYADQRILLELFGLVIVPSLVRLLPTALRTALNLYGRLRTSEGVSIGRFRAAMAALTYAVPAQIGNYLGYRSDGIASLLGPRAFGRLQRFLNRGV